MKCVDDIPKSTYQGRRLAPDPPSNPSACLVSNLSKSSSTQVRRLFIRGLVVVISRLLEYRPVHQVVLVWLYYQRNVQIDFIPILSNMNHSIHEAPFSSHVCFQTADPPYHAINPTS